ncbi:MAG: RnfABCDGE type electron transport complex subunit C [Bacilli bacterium]|nr:RnfABCDGE type electron transport complex subunit C [Bacilli bacterium]
MRGKKIINRKNMSITKNIKKFSEPDYVYIPLISYNNTSFDVKVKISDYVLKGQILAISDDKFSFPIHSSVSGTVKGIEKHSYIDNTLIDTIVIENDFLEKEKKIGSVKKINNYSIEEVLELLKNAGVVGMSGTNYPTYYKYGTELKINTLIVNAVEAESYITSDFTILNSKTSEILETIDALLEIFNINECIIAVKDFNKKAVDDLIQYIGSYTKIKIRSVPDSYTMGWDKYLVKYLLNLDVKNNTIEKSVLVNNVSTIYSIYEALKHRKPIIERIVTFSGEGIKKPQNVLVKVGTKVSDVIKFIGGTKKGNYIAIINGPMMGKMVDDDVIITKNTTGVIILKESTDKEIECINCGKCTNICPVRLAPVLIMDNQNNEKILNKLNPKKCIECGLCSYICPSKIKLRDIVISSKEKVGDK